MTWSLTPLELPLAGGNSKPHHYKHKLQKTKDIPKTWGFNGEIFEVLIQEKKQKHFSRPFKKTQWNTKTLKASIGPGPCER